ncbi:MAG: hypothetical protein II404_13050 [Prevotella sp.]|nr:hypothetical protein [Prevotella sp.]
MGFWKEVKEQWTKEGIRESFQHFSWQTFLCIVVAVAAANTAVDYFNVRETLWLHLAIFFIAWNIGYVISYILINHIRKWIKKN